MRKCIAINGEFIIRMILMIFHPEIKKNRLTYKNKYMKLRAIILFESVKHHLEYAGGPWTNALVYLFC